MYHVFITEGIVLGKRALGEANTRVAVLTRELGLLKIHARSTRVEKSKLRYGLEALTRARFTFVKGRHEWRLTGVADVARDLIGKDAPSRAAAGRVARLLLRLIHGEELTPALYETVQSGLTSLARVSGESAPAGAQESTAVQSIETVLVLRILSHLGYLPNTPELRPFVEQDFFSIEMASEVQKSRALLMRAINDSLSATGL